MDFASLGGLLLGIGALALAFILEGGNLGMLWTKTAFMIVFGGTFGATILSFTLEELKTIPHFLKVVFNEKKVDYLTILDNLVDTADKARREGLLSLESQLAEIDNVFLARGLQLVIDGTDPGLTNNIMEKEIEVFEKNEQVGYDMFMTAGGFAPTMGIIGTVMGMVHVLGNLSDPDKLGGSIAVAFLATLYGIASANILWIPFANKIKLRTNSEIFLMEMILEGILSIQNAENPRVLRDKLRMYLPAETRRELTMSESEMGM
jgi:chemotaxis protein MotA